MRLVAIALCVACAASDSSSAAPKGNEMTREEARGLAADAVRRDDLVIVDDLTQEHDFGWVFFANSAEWARTRKVNDAIPGAGAVIVDKDTRAVVVGGGQPPQTFIAEYRKRKATGVAAKTTETAAAATPTVSVTTDTPSSEQGDVVTVTVEIVNPAKRAVKVDGRLALGDTLTFEVRGDDGKERTITRLETKGREPRVLAAGAKVSTWIDLSHHVELETIGTYTVIARVAAPDGSWSAASQPLTLTRRIRIKAAVAHDGLYAALAEITRGRKAIREKRYADAFKSAKLGIYRLGSQWLPRHATDTTTKAIEEAQKAYEQGDMTAAERLVDAMETRTLAYVERHHHPNLGYAKDLADAAKKADKPEHGLVYARRALDLIGTHYAPDGVIDDTGLKLLAAEDLESKGQIANAASTTIRMLETRISLYEQRWKESL